MTPQPRWNADRGAGLIGMIGGVTVFLGLMLFSVQLLVNLYANSVVTSAAYDGARRVAGARIDHSDPQATSAAMVDAEQNVRELLGAVGDTAELDWSQSTADVVALRVRVQAPRFGLPGVATGPTLGRIDRTARIRVEQWR